MKPTSIQLELNYINEQGVRSTKLFSVKLNKLKLDDSNNSVFHRREISYEMTFSMVIPNHIHALLIGKTVPMRSMHDSNATKKYSDKFSKTINSDTIKGICTQYKIILSHYEWLINIDKAELTKVIFYDFDNESREYRSEWNGTSFGKKNRLDYRFAIGYISTVLGKEVRYNFAKATINQSYDSNFYNNNFVNWTPERELFFENLCSSFDKMASTIDTFKDGLKEDTIDSAIKNNIKLLS